jgi:hypothetical protein
LYLYLDHRTRAPRALDLDLALRLALPLARALALTLALALADYALLVPTTTLATGAHSRLCPHPQLRPRSRGQVRIRISNISLISLELFLPKDPSEFCSVANSWKSMASNCGR